MLPNAPDGWTLLIDVGRDQGYIDVPALRAAGVGGLYIRATDGEHDIDPRFNETAKSCDREDMPCGAYGVLEPYGNSRSKTQADHFASVVSDTRMTLPPWLDFELAGHLAPLDAIVSAVAWRDEVAATLGTHPIVYAGPAFIMQLERLGGVAAMAYARSLALSTLAVAHYTGSVTKMPLVPPPWLDWTIWQASGNGAARMPSGVEVDVDYFRGTIDQLIALGCPPTLRPATIPPPEAT